MEIRYPLNSYASPGDEKKNKIFLAGSIEMGNIDIVCERFNIPQKKDIDELSDSMKNLC